MKPALYFAFYFLTYSAAFACVASCAYARLSGGPAWLRRYMALLVSAIAFMLTMNGAFFAKTFMGLESVESSLAFCVLYMLATAFFLGALARVAFFLASGGKSRWGDPVSLFLAGIPLAFIPLLFACARGESAAALRLLFIDVVMYYAFAVVVAVIAFLFARLKGLTDFFPRMIVRACLYSGVTFLMLSVAQWFSYYDKPYSLDPFCVVNVSLFVLFVLSTVVIGREYLVSDGPAGRALALTMVADDARSGGGFELEDPEFLAGTGLTEKERKIVALIKLGSTNQEIADAIGIKLPAVKSAIYRIFSRYGVSSRAALIHAIGSRRDDAAAKSAAVSGAKRRPEPVGNGMER